MKRMIANLNIPTIRDRPTAETELTMAFTTTG
jgi:hypothetical protein